MPDSLEPYGHWYEQCLCNIINIYYNKLKKIHLVQAGILEQGEKNGGMVSHIKVCGHLTVSGLGELEEGDVFLVPKCSITGTIALISWHPGERKP